MFSLRCIIENRIKELERLIESKNGSALYFPKGSLRISHCGESVTYYNRYGGENHYIKKTDHTFISELGQKDYDLRVVALAKTERDLLIGLLAKYPKITVEEYYATLNPLRQELVKPVLRPDDMFLHDWFNEPFVSKPISDNVPEFITNNNERVRSKSEKIIADRYQFRGVLYKYECPLLLADGTIIHPDFTLMDMRRRSEVYHEHLGRMDDPEYVAGLPKRYIAYEQSGIYLGDRLFVTLESRGMPLLVSSVDELIRRLGLGLN